MLSYTFNIKQLFCDNKALEVKDKCKPIYICYIDDHIIEDDKNESTCYSKLLESKSLYNQTAKSMMPWLHDKMTLTY